MAENWDGTFKEIRFSWLSHDNDDQVRCYVGMDGRVSLATLLDHLREVASNCSPEEVGINFATVTWLRHTTAEEKQQRANFRVRQAERQAQWERETYERLKAKFEPPAGSQVGEQ